MQSKLVKQSDKLVNLESGASTGWSGRFQANKFLYLEGEKTCVIRLIKPDYLNPLEKHKSFLKSKESYLSHEYRMKN